MAHHHPDTLRMATVLLTASGLSFLGLGVQPPALSGARCCHGAAYLITSPTWRPSWAGHHARVMGFNLFGDGLRDPWTAIEGLNMTGPLLTIRNLETHFFSAGKVVRALDGYPSRSSREKCSDWWGRPAAANRSRRFHPAPDSLPPGKIVAGSIRFKDRDILSLPPDQMRAFRAKRSP